MTSHTLLSASLPPLRRRRSRRLAVVGVLLVGTLAAVAWFALQPERAGGLLPSAIGDRGGEETAGGGDLPDAGVSVDDTHLDAVSRLDPELLDAVRRATSAAAADGIELRITSGWRSADYQQQLLDDAIATYGERGARQLVQTPERSRHVTGDAVDVGPTDAAFWMLRHGPDFGLCQVYANEVWHYELLVDPGGTCPPLQQDAS